MAEFPGYLTQNASRSFPFREPESGAGTVPPEDFLLSLRFYLCADSRVDVFLAGLAYDAGADAYTLAFHGAADGAVLLTGTVTRQNAGVSRVGAPLALGSGARLSVLTPGNAWDTPATLGGAGSWTLAFTSGAASVEPSQCMPGPATFRQLAINAETLAADPPLGVALSLTAGSGVEFSIGSAGTGVPSPGAAAAFPAATTTLLTLSAGNGLGEPFAPTPDPTLYVTSLGGQAPDENGAFVLGALDCLRAVQPVVDGTGGASATLLPNTLQLSNDCGPCCGCSDYRRVAKAIARRGAKLADLCGATQSALTSAYAQYQAVVAQVNAARKPLVVTENLFAQDNTLYFTVRNAVEIPLYVYVALELASAATLPLLTLNNSSSLVAYLGSTSAEAGGATFASLVAADQATLPPLGPTPFDATAWPFPFTGADSTDAGWVFRVNARDAGGNLLPLPAGNGFRLSFALTNADGTDPTAKDPLAAPVAAGLAVILRATSLQGQALSNPYAGSKTRSRIVVGDPSAMGGYDETAYVSVVPAPAS